MPCEDGGRDCSDIPTSQEIPKAPDSQELGRNKKGFFPRYLLKILPQNHISSHSLNDTLTLDLQPTEL